MNIRCALAWVAIGLGLSGCGFKPVYMPTASGNPGVAQRELAAVSVGLIPDRPGQLLRQALEERFANDSGVARRYDLQVVFSIAGEGLGIEADNSATRVRLTGNASWTLVAQDPARTRLTSGSARAIDAFNAFDSQYFASDLSNEQVQRRLTAALADQVALQLAIWFRQHSAPASAG